MEKQYSDDKPRSCRYCYFWRGKKQGGCSRGRGKRNCYYLIRTENKPISECDDCPYGRYQPCIGWCTKKVMREVGLIK